MRAPVIGVTGPVASGKTTVARAITGRRGSLIDCDALAHRALADGVVRRRLVAAFGRGILAPSGRISRVRLRSAAFADERSLARLNRIVRPRVRSIITAAVRRERGRAEYIVLDAVLLFQYTFSFSIDLSIAAVASAGERMRRLMARDAITRTEARRIIERQRSLERDWRKADVEIDAGGPIAEVRREARRIRDEFLARRETARGRGPALSKRRRGR
jgi:dephospho-CoA kinase